jgi:pentatricopeptide repeat protein
LEYNQIAHASFFFKGEDRAGLSLSELSITIFNIMIMHCTRVGELEEANDFFAAISANRLLPNASTCGLMIANGRS